MHEVAHGWKRNPLSDLNKILQGGRYPDVITYANFGDDRLRGLGMAGGQSLPFSVDFDRRPYNTTVRVCDVSCSTVLITLSLRKVLAIEPRRYTIYTRKTKNMRPILVRNSSRLVQLWNTSVLSLYSPDDADMLLAIQCITVVTILMSYLHHCSVVRS